MMHVARACCPFGGRAFASAALPRLLHKAGWYCSAVLLDKVGTDAAVDLDMVMTSLEIQCRLTGHD